MPEFWRSGICKRRATRRTIQRATTERHTKREQKREEREEEGARKKKKQSARLVSWRSREFSFRFVVDQKGAHDKAAKGEPVKSDKRYRSRLSGEGERARSKVQRSVQLPSSHQVEIPRFVGSERPNGFLPAEPPARPPRPSKTKKEKNRAHIPG